jgi:hypothetical protein
MKIRSLATKFVALALAACIIPVGIVAIISVIQSTNALTNTLGAELMNKSAMVGNEIDNYLVSFKRLGMAKSQHHLSQF